MTEFEPSPLSRPKKQGAVGAAWQPDVAPSTATYGTNVGGDIRIWTLSGNLPVSADTSDRFEGVNVIEDGPMVQTVL